jgi:mannitol-1-phosphate/altronate dehydrogenase
MKLRFGKTEPADSLPSGRLVTSLEGPRQVPQMPQVHEASSAQLAEMEASAAPAEPAQPVQPARPAESDGLDALAGLVIERLSRSPLPDSLARIVTEVSERLVREEIARIRDKGRTPTTGDGRGST